MSKRPYDGGRGSSGPERYWAAIKRFRGAEFTVPQLHASVPNVSRDAIQLYVKGLLRLGILKPVGTAAAVGSRFAPILYTCIRPHGHAPRVAYGPVSGRYGQHMVQLWTAMRVLPVFGIVELAAVASTDDVPVSRQRAAVFVFSLRDAGLVAVVEPKHGGLNGSTPATFRLLREANTGPKPPQISRRWKGVYDPNRARWIGNPEPREVPA